MSEDLYRLIYRSRRLKSAPADRFTTLSEILASAERHNRLTGVSGILLHDDLWFIQILEGSEDAVRSTYGRIIADERHDDPVLLSLEPVKYRRFQTWSMASFGIGMDSRLAFMRMGIDPAIDRARLTPGQIVSLGTAIAALSDIDFTDEADTGRCVA
jgi:hypothetical protein